MAQAVPSTTYNELSAAINDLKASRHYADKSSMQWRRIERNCRTLINVNACEGWTMLGVAYATAGDVDEMRKAFDNAVQLGMDSADKANRLASYMMVGLYTEAKNILISYAAPEQGMLLGLASSFGPVGAFQSFVEHAEKARKMSLDITQVEEAADLPLAASIVAQADLSDDDIAAHMDAAGAVFRSHRLFPACRISASKVDGIFVGVTTALWVDASPEKVFDLNIELAQEEERRGIRKTPAFDVVFVSRTE